MPTTDKATYRVVEWNGSTVKALCDVYGRLFTRYDSSNDVYNGVAWTDEGLDKTFDSIDEHESAFMTLLQTYGHNDAVTAEGVDNVVINLDGTSTEFTFTDGQLVPVSSAWANGTTPTLFKRTLNDGTADVVVVCDAEGKLVLSTGETGYFKIINGGLGSATANQAALVTAAGGSVEATTFGDNDGNYSLISLDDYTVVADQDGIITVGTISDWVDPTNLFYRVTPYNDLATPIIVDEDGKAVVVVENNVSSVLKYNIATGVITEDNTEGLITFCESFTGGLTTITKSTDQSGNTVYTNDDYSITVNQSGVASKAVTEYNYTSAIAVSGVVQVFSDAACKRYYDGRSNKAYVRLNQQFGQADGRVWGSTSDLSTCLIVTTPTPAAPSDPYKVTAYVDLMSANMSGPLTQGQIVTCEMPAEYFSDIANPRIVFTA